MACVFLDFFFFFNDTATTKIYTLSLHDALPIYLPRILSRLWSYAFSGKILICLIMLQFYHWEKKSGAARDRKSTRLNSSHVKISYAVFCLKKKTENINFSLCADKF